MSDRTIIYESNRIKKVVEKIPNGAFPTNKGILEYTYDDSNNLVSTLSNATSSYYYTYDNKGLLITKREKYPEGFDTLTDAIVITQFEHTFWK